MFNQQDASQLQQQASHFEASWQSDQETALLWQLCLSRDLLHRKRLAIQEEIELAKLPGALKISSELLPELKSESWLELPAQWVAPEWFKVERFQGRQAYLAWEWQLRPHAEGSELRLKLSFVVPAELLKVLESYFEELKKVIGQELKQLGQPGWLEPESPPESWQTLIGLSPEPCWQNEVRRQLNLNGMLLPGLLIRRSGLSQSAGLPLLLEACQQQLVLAFWQCIEADETMGVLRHRFDEGWQSLRWQQPAEPEAPETRQLSQFSLRLMPTAAAETMTNFQTWSVLSEHWGRILLWPGQQYSLKPASSCYWQLADGSLKGEISLSAKAEKTAQIELSSELSIQTRIQAGGELVFSNQTSRLQLICLSATEQSQLSAQELLGYQAATPLLAERWQEGLNCSGWYLSLQAPLSKAFEFGLDEYLYHQGGCRLQTQTADGQPDSLYLFFSEARIALRCAHHLLKSQARTQAWGLSSEFQPRLSLTYGQGQIWYQEPHRFELRGPLQQYLQTLNQQGQGWDLVIPAESVQDARLRSAFEPHWRVREFQGQQAAFFQFAAL